MVLAAASDAVHGAGVNRKLYCYVDESGQDTRGELFVVATVVLAEDRPAVISALEAAEGASGKGKVKWAKARRADRQRFLELIAQETKLRHALYSKVFRQAGRHYQGLTALTVAQALNLYMQRQGLTEYKATVIIDGLTRTEERTVGRELRQLGVRTRKVRGARDENEAAIRLADTLAGLVREAEEDAGVCRRLREQLALTGLLREL